MITDLTKQLVGIYQSMITGIVCLLWYLTQPDEEAEKLVVERVSKQMLTRKFSRLHAKALCSTQKSVAATLGKQLPCAV